MFIPLNGLKFDNSFARLPENFYSRVRPDPLPDPQLVSYNPRVGALLGWVGDDVPLACRDMAAGQWIPPGADPLAMAYAGHQFGGYSPQLGDGRGLLLGEVVGPGDTRWDLHIKGAGATPYARTGDGRAVLRSSIREYLGSEAMAGLGIPSTRALCVVASPLAVMRETPETGAAIARVATTHIRFGHFEYFYHRGEHRHLGELLDYTLARHFPALLNEVDFPAALLLQVAERTAATIAAWQAVGFTHGVMNTDNMAINGDTLDFGPFGFQDHYRFDYNCNHSDYSGRYSFDQQPAIGLWNLNALAEALSPWVNATERQAALTRYQQHYLKSYEQRLCAKVGLSAAQPGDRELLFDLLELLNAQQVDYTRFFRALSWDDPDTMVKSSASVLFSDPTPWLRWRDRLRTRLDAEPVSSKDSRREKMLSTNPKYVLRNYMAQAAIERAERGDFQLVEQLLYVVQSPFEEHAQADSWSGPIPFWAQSLELSCSS